MGLETATTINELNPSNPTGGDVRSSADDHLRLIKSTLKNTFPNITGAVTATQATLNKLGTTPTVGDNSTDPASTAFVQQTLASAAVNGAMALVLQPATTGAAAPGQHVVQTNVAATAITLPAAPPGGSRVWVTATNGLATNTILRNGALLDGVAGDYAISGNGTVKLRYIDAPRGWIVESDRTALTWAKLGGKPNTVAGLGLSDFALEAQAAAGFVSGSSTAQSVFASNDGSGQFWICLNATSTFFTLPAPPAPGQRIRVLFMNNRLDNKVWLPGGVSLKTGVLTVGPGEWINLDLPGDVNAVHEFVFSAATGCWHY